jgi:hypothetical protein
METSVFKEILDRSISGDKIYGGYIDWIDGIRTSELIVGAILTGEGTGSINGSAFNIGNLNKIQSVNTYNLSADIITAGILTVSSNIIFDSNKSLVQFYSDYYSITKSEVDDLILKDHYYISKFIVTQLRNIDVSGLAINAQKWSFLSTMQDVTSGRSVNFGNITGTGVTVGTTSIAVASITSTALNGVTANLTGQISGKSLNINSNALIDQYGALSVKSITIPGLAYINSDGEIGGTLLDVGYGTINGGIISGSNINASDGFKTTSGVSGTGASCGQITLNFGQTTIFYTDKCHSNSIVLISPVINSSTGTTVYTPRITSLIEGSFSLYNPAPTSTGNAIINWMIVNPI